MNKDFIKEKLFETLKELLKKRNITYKKLANNLKLSEPSIKRMFQEKNITFDRLLEISNFLGISLKDFVNLIELPRQKSYIFTRECEDFLSKNTNFYYYLDELYNNTPLEIERKHKLTRESTKKYLTKLHDLNLINFNGLTDVQIKIGNHTYWDDNGPLGKAFTSQHIERRAKKAISKLGNQNEMILHDCDWILSKQDYLELKLKLSELRKYYSEKSFYNARILTKKEKQLISFIAIADIEEEKIENKIKNI